MSRFLEELKRFVEKYEVQPDPMDTDAVFTYWAEVDAALVAWNKRYQGKPHYDTYCPMMVAAFEMLESLFKEKSDN